jgi:subtilisin family serine protease
MKKISIYAGLLLSLTAFNTFSYTIKKDGLITNGIDYFKMPSNITKEDYMDKTIIFKVKESYREQCAVNALSVASLNQIMMQLGTTKLEKMFPFAQKPTQKVNKLNQPYADLTLVYVLKYENNVDLEWAINQIIKTGTVEYAQPYYIQKLFYTPNDYNGTQQSFLNQIKALQAWDLTKGDTNVVIGIVDSGTDLDHPDLVANFKRNYADPINGIDDDNDGYTDNYWGIDLAGADYNNIQWDNDPDIKGSNQSHGAHVSGDASAVTDNGVGVSGVGFKCKLLPVKCGADNDTRGSGGVGYILTGYQGIVYAADHGANVINCSWGGPGGGPLEQEVINYATINKGALVVAAAGNDNKEDPYYPASFNYVINIAAVGSFSGQDVKASFSNYGYTIDFCAPGNNIRSTAYNNTYGSSSGTSMASPIAAGAAAIVKSYFPSYNMIQVGEQLRVTCDNIYSVNPSYNNKLGSGRINLYAALTTQKPSIRYQNLIIKDFNDDALVAGDTMRFIMDFVNYLAPTSNCTATLTVQSGGLFVTIQNGTFNIGQLGTLALKNTSTAPFRVLIKSNAPQNQKITFKITYTDNATSYTASEFFDVYVNVDYINIGINQVAATITSKGRIGYNQSGQGQGIGFTYNGVNLIYESSLMVGNTSKVSDMVRSSGGTTDEDFVSMIKVSKVAGTMVSDFDATGKFNDNGNSKGALPVEVNHYAYAWTNAPDDKYIMLRYVIKNTGTSTLNNLYAGIFTDFDIDDYSKNKGNEDAQLKLGYTYSVSSNVIYGGVKVLSPTPFIHHSIDNTSGAYVDFTGAGDYDQKKDSVMKISKPTDTFGPGGGDVIQCVSSGPFNLVPGDSVEVAFALIAGDNLSDIQASANAAQTRYNDLFAPTAIVSKINPETMLSLYPNPSKDVVSLNFNLLKSATTQIEIYTLTGQKVFELVKDFSAGMNQEKIDISNLSSGQYFVKLTTHQQSSVIQLNVVK